MASKSIRVGDLPGMRAFFDAVGALLDTVNAEADVPPAVQSAADLVRVEALGIGNGPEIAVEEDEKSPARLESEGRLRTAMNVARENPGHAVIVDWAQE